MFFLGFLLSTELSIGLQQEGKCCFITRYLLICMGTGPLLGIAEISYLSWAQPFLLLIRQQYHHIHLFHHNFQHKTMAANYKTVSCPTRRGHAASFAHIGTACIACVHAYVHTREYKRRTGLGRPEQGVLSAVAP